MQLMSWTMARLGSRFSLLFEPHRRRVLHAALGRFLDEPVDLRVGLIEPDGTWRTLPFTSFGQTLFNCEQFERLNSITFRGFSERYRLRFEFNVHAVFYPQHEELCLLPAFYLEMRVGALPGVRWIEPAGATPQQVKLFFCVHRPETTIRSSTEHDAAIAMSYQAPLVPRRELAGSGWREEAAPGSAQAERRVAVQERIVSLNPGCAVHESGHGLTLDLPATDPGSGIKWRLVWAAHCGEPVLNIAPPGQAAHAAPLRYTRFWGDLDAVVKHAIEQRDTYLAHSRTFEKTVEQAPLDQAQRHLLHQSFQTFLGNTFWCSRQGAGDAPPSPEQGTANAVAPEAQWITTWAGSCFQHATLDVEYSTCLLYLSLWPKLLALQLEQWVQFARTHEESGGSYMSHDLGWGPEVTGQHYPRDLPVEENCNYLLILQAYAHWTGDMALVERQAALVERLGQYLLWSDQDGSGFASEGIASMLDDAAVTGQAPRKQTYLAVKRAAALRAAADLLERVGARPAARRCDDAADFAASRIERTTWRSDHYAAGVDRLPTGTSEVWARQSLPRAQMQGGDAYSIYTGNGLLLPMMAGQPLLLDRARLIIDYHSATRETLGPYGCGHSSAESEEVWVSQNIWRDLFIRYLGQIGPMLAPRYWDMQVMSNTAELSLGYVDTYITHNLTFHPSGIASIGWLLARPRLVIDRLAPGGARISVEPDRHRPQRWPLLALADWQAGKVPVCVVDNDGAISIEGETDPVIIHGGDAVAGSGFIG